MTDEDVRNILRACAGLARDVQMATGTGMVEVRLGPEAFAELVAAVGRGTCRLVAGTVEALPGGHGISLAFEGARVVIRPRAGVAKAFPRGIIRA